MKVWNLGYPRIGKKRELKKALEGFWSGNTTVAELEAVAKKLLADRWARQHALGVESIPLNDFSFYDHVLDTAYLMGMIPNRFRALEKKSGHWLELYFAMARGSDINGKAVAPLDMTKWFNTNYHYLVPEVESGMDFTPRFEKLFFELDHCRSYPYRYHVVLVGPWTLLKVSRLSGISHSDFLNRVIPTYQKVLAELKRRKVEWVQIDEPALCGDLQREDLKTVKRIYDELSGPNILLTTYFESPEPWLSELASLRVQGLHFDLVQGSRTMSYLKTKSFPKDKVLSLGIVSGRNVWASSLHEIRRELVLLGEMYDPARIVIAPSCSLLHLPHDKNLEGSWPADFLSWVSFADQRLEELRSLKNSLLGDRAFEAEFDTRDRDLQKRTTSSQVHIGEIRQAVEKIDEGMKRRKSDFTKRSIHKNLPPLPTTSVGSFPQTEQLRKARVDLRNGKIDPGKYDETLRKEIGKVIALQEKLDMDVLVHGEPERTDMVEYFAESLEGFRFSSHGWVQSYGSRCVKPPLLFGDVKRKEPITVKWFKYSQSLTKRPVKGMLTGPVTLLNWSFVREDQPREKTVYQLALALREEVKDLEDAGAKVIQIDEPALREGLPLKKGYWNQYLKWAVDAFRISSGGAKDETQIHTHMCYSEFGDIFDSIAKMDADVLLIEFARSGDSFLDAFRRHHYLKDIGPGIYDIHSPRVPSVEECEAKLKKLLTLFPAERLWVTPDCGLKTRRYEEVEKALEHLVQAAKNLRKI